MAFEPTRLATRFASLRDPRVHRTRRHEFIDIVMIAICSVLSGADSFVEMERFARVNQGWFASFLSLPAGIPSHDTIARLLARLDPVAFSSTLNQWALAAHTSPKSSHPSPSPTIAVDGKCLRASVDRASGIKALHLLTAWCSTNNLVLAQQKVADKSNEITAVEPLLDQIDIAGSIVTMDALHTQKETARYLRKRGAHYLLALKDNHPRLRDDVAGFFERTDRRGFWTDQGQPLPYGSLSTHNNDHGRLETRHYLCAPAPSWLDGFDEWAQLNTLIRVDRTRQIGPNISTERSYYLSSLPLSPRRLARAIRSHWSIENNLHWIVDIAYDEDRCRVRKQHAAQNLASVRRFTLAMLKYDQTTKVGIKAKRKMAGWDENYRAKLVNMLCS